MSTQGHTTYARTFTVVRTSTQGRTTYARTFTRVRTGVRIFTLRGATTAQEPHMLTLGQEIIAWIEEHCRVPEGALVGRPLVLMDWQRDAIKRIYDNDHGTRRCIISVARKNGKTCFAACLLLNHLAGPSAVSNSQLYSAAQSRDQAALIYQLAAKMVRMSPALSDMITLSLVRTA